MFWSVQNENFEKVVYETTKGVLRVTPAAKISNVS